MPRACFLLILWLLCLRVVCFVLDVGIFCFMCLVYLGDALFSLMNYLLIKKIYRRFQLSLSLSLSLKILCQFRYLLVVLRKSEL